MTPWRPFKTAPKDGTSFLAYDGNQNWVGVVWYSMAHDHYLYAGGMLLYRFTHWMPIPKFPKEKP